MNTKHNWTNKSKINNEFNTETGPNTPKVLRDHKKMNLTCKRNKIKLFRQTEHFP